MLNLREFMEKVKEQLSPQDIDHHCSDLYIRKTGVLEKLIKQYEYKNFVKVFRDNIEHTLWYEIPFAYCSEVLQ